MILGVALILAVLNSNKLPIIIIIVGVIELDKCSDGSFCIHHRALRNSAVKASHWRNGGL